MVENPLKNSEKILISQAGQGKQTSILRQKSGLSKE